MTGRKKRENHLVAKIVLVFLMLAFAVNLVSDAVQTYYKVDVVGALIFLLICIILAWVLLGDKIREAI